MVDSATAMDRQYGWQRHIYDLTRKPYLLGRDLLISQLQPPPGGSVLEIGCGTGRNLIVAARRYPNCRFYGLDVSRVMLDQAQGEVSRAGLSGRIRLRLADATDFNPQSLFGLSQFDRVFISYSLSMIPGWRGVIDAALKLTAPGASFHVVDFGDLAHLPGAFRALLRWWLGLFSVHPRRDLADSLRRAAAGSGTVGRFEPLYRGYAVYARIDKTI